MPYISFGINNVRLLRISKCSDKSRLTKCFQTLYLSRQIFCSSDQRYQKLKIEKETVFATEENEKKETESPTQDYLIDSQDKNDDERFKHTQARPLIHLPSRGIVTDFNTNFFRKVSKSQLKEKDSPQTLILNERGLLKSIQGILTLYPKVKKGKAATGNELNEAIANPSTFSDWHEQKLDIKKLPHYYAKLAKIRLTGLVVMTTIGGYIIAPGALDPMVLLYCSLGTALASSGANTFNQFLEIPYDSQMNRTKNRVLVRGLLTPLHSVAFGAFCFGGGVSLLYFGVNELTAALGALNFFLYTCAYTPLKRISIVNTWVGSIVGAIPPLMGWAACTGHLSAGGFVLAGLLYAWQFPHFNSLSWNLRPDYSRAGYRMMSVTDPGLCRRTALRYSGAIVGLSLLAPLSEITSWTFAAGSLPLNLYLTFLAYQFHEEADSQSSRKLFRFSLVHLPALLLLLIACRKQAEEKDLSITKKDTAS